MWGFWWRGAVPALLLGGALIYGVTRFAHHDIERDVRDTTAAVMRANGLGWIDVKADGQNVRLTGQLPPGASLDTTRSKAIALAEATECDSWLGHFDCTRKVSAEFTMPQPAVLAPPPATPPAWHDVRATLEGGVLTLVGEVPSEAARNALVAAAQTTIAAPRITDVRDRLTIATTPAMAGWPALASRVVTTLTGCQSGTASVIHGEYTIRCTVTRAAKSRVETAASASVEAPGKLGTVLLVVAEDAAACDHQLGEVLAGSTIQFASGSAVIAPASHGLLERIAKIAKDCPGNLRIEGHTDDVGQAAANLVLSQQRAEAVRSALVTFGVADARLIAKGFGQTKPKIANRGAAERAQNRRIEFFVTTAAE